MSALAAATALLTSTACFHAVVETGRPAGTTVVQKPWVNTFVFGLVPAQEINVGAECPGGIAKVETQQSLVNSLAAIVTLGIYTPQTATITCAAGRSGSLNLSGEHVVVAANDSQAARVAAVNAAAAESARSDKPVFVKF